MIGRKPQGPITVLSGLVVDTVRVEGETILDLCHRFKWGLISPHRVQGAISACRNAVVGSVALVGAIRRPRYSIQHRTTPLGLRERKLIFGSRTADGATHCGVRSRLPTAEWVLFLANASSANVELARYAGSLF